MGNKDYLSGGCDMGWCADLPGKLCYEKLDKKKSENDYMIMPENFNNNLEQKRGPCSPPPSLPPPPPPQKKKKKKKKKNRFGFFVKIHLLENSK